MAVGPGRDEIEKKTNNLVFDAHHFMSRASLHVIMSHGGGESDFVVGGGGGGGGGAHQMARGSRGIHSVNVVTGGKKKTETGQKGFTPRTDHGQILDSHFTI